MILKVYLETSFFNECCTIRTGDIDRGRRATSLAWWNTQAPKFDLFISAEVVRELSNEDFPQAARDPALAMLRGLAIVPYSAEVASLADLLVRERVMPGPATAGDAIHLASAIIHQMDFLLTWNQKHVANPNKRVHLSVICARVGITAPQMVTPDLLVLEENNE